MIGSSNAGALVVALVVLSIVFVGSLVIVETTIDQADREASERGLVYAIGTEIVTDGQTARLGGPTLNGTVDQTTDGTAATIAEDPRYRVQVTTPEGSPPTDTELTGGTTRTRLLPGEEMTSERVQLDRSVGTTTVPAGIKEVHVTLPDQGTIAIGDRPVRSLQGPGTESISIPAHRPTELGIRSTRADKATVEYVGRGPTAEAVTVTVERTDRDDQQEAPSGATEPRKPAHSGS